MTTVAAHLTNQAYGFPARGAQRRVKAPILACIHITGNRRTAANPDRHQAARDERNYANRVGSNGPSAHYCVARDGWAIEAIDPAKHAAWSNGDVASPNTANAGIAKVLALRAKGYNANEAYWLEFECVGYGSTYPITKAQKQFCATRIAAMAKATGLPINRTTVHGHGDINSVSRASCPCPKASREAFLGDVITRANAILRPPITTVTIKSGDTLSEIAAAHRLTLTALLAFPENTKYRQSGAHSPGRHRAGEVSGGAMDSQPGTIWGREPGMVLALVQALIALVVAFGLNLAPDQIGAILAVTAVILGLITRSRVSPP